MPITYLPATGVKSYPVKDFVENAYFSCGLLAEQQTPQYVETAVLQLNYLLQDLSNQGELLFQYRSVLISPLANTRQYVLPVGTIDIRFINYRYQSIPLPNNYLPTDNPTAINAFSTNLYGNTFIATAAENWIGGDWGSTGYRPNHIGLNPKGGFTFNCVLEYSVDGISWVLQTTFPKQTINDLEWYYIDLDGQGTYQYWRVRETSTTPLNLRQVVFGTNTYTIPLARLNKDEYWALTNRSVQFGSRTLQYWYDRQNDPVVNFWPITQDDFQLFEILAEAQLPDIAFGDSIPMPNRWMNYVQAALSAKMASILPGVDPNRIALLNQLAASAYQVASGEERDKSPFYLRPNVSYYTQI